MNLICSDCNHRWTDPDPEDVECPICGSRNCGFATDAPDPRTLDWQGVEHDLSHERLYEIGERVYNTYDCVGGEIVGLGDIQPAGVHGVTGDPLPASRWYRVRLDGERQTTILNPERMRPER